MSREAAQVGGAIAGIGGVIAVMGVFYGFIGAGDLNGIGQPNVPMIIFGMIVAAIGSVILGIARKL